VRDTLLEELSPAKKHGSPVLAELVGVGLTATRTRDISGAQTGGSGPRQCAPRSNSRGSSAAGGLHQRARYQHRAPTDASETAAIKEVFGDHARRLKISATKSMVGHLLGAAAAVELIACVLSIRDGKIHPTINRSSPTPVRPRHVRNKAVNCDVTSPVELFGSESQTVHSS